MTSIFILFFDSLSWNFFKSNLIKLFIFLSPVNSIEPIEKLYFEESKYIGVYPQPLIKNIIKIIKNFLYIFYN